MAAPTAGSALPSSHDRGHQHEDRVARRTFAFPETPWRSDRVGYGTMQVAWPGVLGPSKHRGAALAGLREAVEPVLTAAAARKYGRENGCAIARFVIGVEVNRPAREVEGRWSGKLDDVDARAASQCRTALVYDEWDVRPHGRPA